MCRLGWFVCTCRFVKQCWCLYDYALNVLSILCFSIPKVNTYFLMLLHRIVIPYLYIWANVFKRHGCNFPRNTFEKRVLVRSDDDDHHCNCYAKSMCTKGISFCLYSLYVHSFSYRQTNISFKDEKSFSTTRGFVYMSPSFSLKHATEK